MIFVTGPLFSGKKDYIKNNYNISEEEFEKLVIENVQDMVTDATSENLVALADKLSQYEFVIATEVGGGVVPVDRNERLKREAAGRLAVMLAQRADNVIRVVCGIPQVLK
jgi:adenosyl cobinamide kinase/adenosyl cobinamide phosphate guanylyltransferase